MHPHAPARTPLRHATLRRRAAAVVTVAIVAVVVLWSLWDEAPSAAAVAAALAGGGTRHLALPDGVIAYDDRGEGPLVVMLPGLGDLRQQYRFLAPVLLDAGYRVATADLRGHGGSSVDWPDYGSEAAGADLVALLEALDGGRAVVVGTSFGAGPAVWAAAERPDLVAGLVLIGPFVRDHETPPLMGALLRVMTAGPWKVRAWGWYYGTLYPSAKPPDFDAYRAALVANLAEPGRFEAVRGMMFRSDAEVEARLGAVGAPTLIMMGSADPDFPDPAAEARIVAEAVSGEVVMIDGAGHYPHVEMPAIAGPVVERFARDAHGRQ